MTAQLRTACAAVAERAGHVRIDVAQIPLYAAALERELARAPSRHPPEPPEDPEAVSAYWLTLNAINFGSGWFPTLRKQPGRSGYNTIAAGLREHFGEHGPWSAAALTELTPDRIARVLGQDPDHPLMTLFAESLGDLGAHVESDHGGEFAALAGATGGSAAGLARVLGGFRCFADTSVYDDLELPFLKRAQIAAADLTRAGVIAAPDLDQLTMFADNLVPHVLRLDGILLVSDELVARIEREELIEHDSREEIELRACALHAVELIVGQQSATTAATIDELLWQRGQDRRYKAVPRHRCRCTAY